MNRKYFWVGVPVILGLGAAALWQYARPPATAAIAPSAPAIPVIATKAQKQSVSDYLTGLGTVQAFNRVTIHVRVDGELQEITFTEGQFVRAGDVLAKIDPRMLQAMLDQAKAKKAQDKAQLVAAEKDLVRFKTLVMRSFETQQNVDLQQAKVDQLKASIDADQAAIEYAETQLSYTTIVSPLDGRMGMRLIDKGNIVHASDPGGLVVITQVHPIAVIFSVPEDHLPAITAAMKQGGLKVRAYSRDNATKLGEGVLLLIDNQIDASTGTLRLKTSFPNEDDALWPGQFVNAQLELAMRNDAVAVPAQVVQRGPNGLYAYVVKPDQRVERRGVKVGPVRDGWAVIEEGLSPGEQVVVDGQFKLRPGAKVAVTMLPVHENSPAAEKTAERSPQVVR
jgi:membrane fusion protein, multidrug efflux system